MFLRGRYNVAMGIYITKSDVQNVYGIDNVDTWADLDGDAVQSKLDARIAQGIDYGETYVEDRLRASLYSIPFQAVESRGLVSTKNQMARLAGFWLYQSRGLRDNEETTDKMRVQFEDAEDFLDRVTSGQIALGLARKHGNDSTGPTVLLGPATQSSASRGGAGR